MGWMAICWLGGITSVLSERPFKLADQKTERGKMLNPEYNICRDQPTSRASPLRINDLLSRAPNYCQNAKYENHCGCRQKNGGQGKWVALEGLHIGI